MLKSIYDYLFKKKSETETETKIPTVDQIFSGQVLQIEDDSVPKNIFRQWTPNDELAHAHDKASELVGKVPNLLKKIKQHQEKIDTIQNSVEKIQNKENLNPYDHFELIEYKKDILAEQSKISTIELQIDEAKKYTDNQIFEKFVLYLESAEKYIKEEKLTGIMSPNDILTSEGIYIKLKSSMDILKYRCTDQTEIKRLQFVSQHFDMKEIYENYFACSRGSLRD